MRFVKGKPPLEYLYTLVLLAGGHPQYLGRRYPQSRGQARLKTDTVGLPHGLDHRAGEKWLPSSRARTRRSLDGAKGKEAMRQIDFGDWRGPQGPVNTISDEEIDHKRSGSD
jgi:hypothetical protein